MEPKLENIIRTLGLKGTTYHVDLLGRYCETFKLECHQPIAAAIALVFGNKVLIESVKKEIICPSCANIIFSIRKQKEINPPKDHMAQFVEAQAILYNPRNQYHLISDILQSIVELKKNNPAHLERIKVFFYKVKEALQEPVPDIDKPHQLYRKYIRFLRANHIFNMLNSWKEQAFLFKTECEKRTYIIQCEKKKLLETIAHLKEAVIGENIDEAQKISKILCSQIHGSILN